LVPPNIQIVIGHFGFMIKVLRFECCVLRKEKAGKYGNGKA
jgi:hypothetical protein